MKTIVCYGDSNTWGYMPKAEPPAISAENRFPWGVRWTSRLQMQLGDGYRVAEAGLNGRTTIFDCPMGEHRSGRAHIDACMHEQMPVDLAVLMLGTNDTKAFFGASPYLISCGALQLIERIRSGGYGPGGHAPEVLLISPIRLHPNAATGWLGEEFDASSLEKDAQLGRYLRRAADECGAHFLDAGAHITADPADGVHMNEAGHAALAQLVCERVLSILG